MSDLIDKMIFLLVLFGVALAGLRGYRLIRTRLRSMTADELSAWLDEGRDLLILDVRNEAEYAVGHIDGAVGLPVQQLSARLASVKSQLSAHRGTTVVLVCRSGVRSSNALMQLEWAGLKNVHLLKGGMEAWIAQSRPICQDAV